MRLSIFTMLSAIALSSIGTALADEDAFQKVIAARQGQFNILEYNLSLLEEMVSGKTAYDQEVAENRAENIQMATRLNQDRNWLPGSDLAPVHGTLAQGVRADPAAFKAKWTAMMERADTLAAAAGKGAAEMAPAVTAMRATCSSCHQFYREAP